MAERWIQDKLFPDDDDRGQEDSPESLGAYVGVSGVTVRNWMNIGLLDGCVYPNGRIDRKAAIDALEASGKIVSGGVSDKPMKRTDYRRQVRAQLDIESLNAEKLQKDIEYKDRQIRKLDLSIEREEGQMMPVSVVMNHIRALAIAVSQGLEQLERRLPNDVVTCTMLHEAKELVAQHVDSVRNLMQAEMDRYGESFDQSQYEDGNWGDGSERDEGLFSA